MTQGGIKHPPNKRYRWQISKFEAIFLYWYLMSLVSGSTVDVEELKKRRKYKWYEEVWKHYMQ